jgi:hypothetical protein
MCSEGLGSKVASDSQGGFLSLKSLTQGQVRRGPTVAPSRLRSGNCGELLAVV